MNAICTLCPSGCELEVKEENGVLTVSGNACKRGESYGKEEFTSPKRTVTALIKTKSGKVRPVKTATPINKDKIFELLALIKNTVVPDSLRAGDTALKSVLGLTDIIITG